MLLLIFTNSRLIYNNLYLYTSEYQENRKAVLLIMVKPPFLLCKDNTIICEMQIAVS